MKTILNAIRQTFRSVFSGAHARQCWLRYVGRSGLLVLGLATGAGSLWLGSPRAAGRRAAPGNRRHPVSAARPPAKCPLCGNVDPPPATPARPGEWGHQPRPEWTPTPPGMMGAPPVVAASRVARPNHAVRRRVMAAPSTPRPVQTPPPPSAAITFDPPGGVFLANQMVKLVPGVPDTVIRYTVNGAVPTATSPGLQRADHGERDLHRARGRREPHRRQGPGRRPPSTCGPRGRRHLRVQPPHRPAAHPQLGHPQRRQRHAAGSRFGQRVRAARRRGDQAGGARHLHQARGCAHPGQQLAHLLPEELRLRAAPGRDR